MAKAITRKRVAACLVATLVALCAVELACRVACWTGILTYDGQTIRLTWQEVAGGNPPATGELPKARAGLSPYLGFLYTTSTVTGPYGVFSDEIAASGGLAGVSPTEEDRLWAINNLGIPGRCDIPYVKREGDFVILVVGGSVALHFSVYHGTDELGRLLGAAPLLKGKRLIFLNGAAGGYKAPAQSLMLAYMSALGQRVDAVVNIDGFNEAALVYENMKHGISPVYPSYRHWLSMASAPTVSIADPRIAKLMAEAWDAREKARELAATGLRYPISRSAVLGLLWDRRIRRELAAAKAAELDGTAWLALAQAKRNPTLAGPRPNSGEGAEAAYAAACLDQASTVWKSNSVFLARCCKGAGIPYVHVLQPTLHLRDSKPFSAAEHALPVTADWVTGVDALYPLFRAAADELRAADVLFCDCTMLFQAEHKTLYFDHVHFGYEGHRRLAEKIAEVLLPAYAALSKHGR